MPPAVLSSPLPVGFLNLGFAEMVVFGVIALLVFGDKLPEAMRSIGKGYMKFRRGVQDATRPVREEMAKLEREANRVVTPTTIRPRRAPDTASYSPPQPQPPAGDFRVPYPTGLEDVPPPSPMAPLPPPNAPPEAPPPEAPSAVEAPAPDAAPSPTPPARTAFTADDEPPPV